VLELPALALGQHGHAGLSELEPRHELDHRVLVLTLNIGPRSSPPPLAEQLAALARQVHRAGLRDELALAAEKPDRLEPAHSRVRALHRDAEPAQSPAPSRT